MGADMSDRKAQQEDGEQQRERRPYTPPAIYIYTCEELTEQLGPAMACSPAPCPVTPGSSPFWYMVPPDEDE